jgi:ribose transport system permease protein
VLLAGIVSQPGPFQGNNYLLPSVAAVALGGTSLLGGVGSVVASAMGALFLSQLQQFVLATGASAAVQNLVQAGALALAVTVYGLRLRPGRLMSGARSWPPITPQSRDGTTDPQPDNHRAPVT